MEYTFSGNPWYVENETYADVIIGLHVPKRFDKILSINECHINDPIFNDLNTAIKNKANELKLEPYDVVRHKGFLRFQIHYHFLNLHLPKVQNVLQVYYLHLYL